MVRLHDPQLAALNRWIEAQPEPRPTRPEAIRRLLGEKLKSQGHFARAKHGDTDARAAGKAYAKGAAAAAVDRIQSGTEHTADAKARRKHKLTTIPRELSANSERGGKKKPGRRLKTARR